MQQSSRVRTVVAVAMAAGAATFVAATPRTARADMASEVKLLERKDEAVRYSVPTSGSEIRTGGASILVDAPIARVERLVLRFGRYKEMIPSFEQSRLVQAHRTGDHDVYVEVPVLSGASKLWALLRFSKPDPRAEGRVIAARMIKGNMADFRSVWRLVPVDAKRTLLKLEMFIDPNLPVPNSIIEEGLTEASDEAVTGIRDFAEGRKKLAKKK
jgi:ribosome-associated toxin RatA of RatAB toxin-antitoxin module